MLKLRRNFHLESTLDFPHSIRGSVQHKFAFAPIAAEEDELLDSIEEARTTAWELGEQPDAGLETFWDSILTDVRSDPEWNFASDD